MIKVEIKPSQVKLDMRSGISQKTQKPYTLYEQNAYIYLGAEYPSLFRLTLNEGQQPYPAGFYELHESSLMIGSYSRLMVGNIVLLPLQNGK